MKAELSYDMVKEKEFKQQVIQKKKEEVKDVIEFKQINHKEKERVERENYVLEKTEIQARRERYRRVEVAAQLKELQKKEKDL